MFRFIAITSLACFIAQCKGLEVPEGDFENDVEGAKAIVFDVGKDERKLEKVLPYCRKHLDTELPSSIIEAIG